MMRAGFISPLAVVVATAVAGCEQGPRADAPAPDYMGVETRLLEGDLVNFRVAMRNPGDADGVDAYARCAAAQYALIRGYGFARHLRTNVEHEGGLWRGDAVYTISAQLPRGMRTIDAEVVVAHCAENGIPTV
ncbi:hypothetical protein [Sediminimonas sp.]|jgi:hypothetical protein|uniref:hypothetical protein n=1 Tax=Sediminimonas sp. TaxID=2823379 RepID=UPI0025D0EE4B|nr:hypothetical protein [Sediminimonas sp.]